MTTPTAAADEYSEEAKKTFKSFVHKVSHAGLHSLRLQYNDLKAFLPPNFSHGASDSNAVKCRYKDIICLDSSRVVLRWPPGSTDDFVHANWVTHDLFDNKFICSQAPLDSTVNDFWRICWQEDVRQILMLCRCEELGKAKCAQYWPTEVDDMKILPLGLTIKCEKVDKSDKNFIHTKLLVSYGQESRHLSHRQWTTWPDKSVPQTPLAPFRLLQFTRKEKKRPSLIHCSAGVGRTGTMVAIEMIYKSLASAVMPEPIKLLQNLRSQRFLAVQTEDQYVYCHYAIIQFAYAKKMAAKHDVKFFCKEYTNYVKIVADNGGRAPPMNATKLPIECKVCKEQQSHVEVDPNRGEQSSPMNTKITPSGLSPLHEVQSMPNWSSFNDAGASNMTQQQTKSTDPKKQLNPAFLGQEKVHDAIPLTENVGNDHSQRNQRTEPICAISNKPMTATNDANPNFTVSTKGGKCTKIVYHRNPEKPFVKAIAGTGGPSMQISVPKNQLEEFYRQLKIKAEELERKKKQEADEAAKSSPPPPPPQPPQPPKKDPPGN